MRTNGLGLPIAITLSAGEVSDMKGFVPVMSEPGPDPKIIIADKGYDSNDIRKHLNDRQIVPIIPMRRNRKIIIQIDDHIYALRNLIERCFAKLKQSRRLATRYDKTSISYVAFVLIASARIWIRHFVNTA